MRKCKVSFWASLQIKNFIHIHYYHYFVNIFIKGLQLISIKETLNKVITKIIFFFSFFVYFNSPVLIKIMSKIASDGKYTYKKCISRKCPNENAQNNWYLVPPYIYISSHSDAIVELFSYRKGADFFMKCLFAEVHQFYLSTKRLTKITVAFKYYCIIEFVYLQTVIIYIYVMYVRLPQV